MITTLLTEYPWQQWKFARTPNGFWQDENNQQQYINALADHLNIKDQSDWYKVTKQVIRNF